MMNKSMRQAVYGRRSQWLTLTIGTVLWVSVMAAVAWGAETIREIGANGDEYASGSVLRKENEKELGPVLNDDRGLPTGETAMGKLLSESHLVEGLPGAPLMPFKMYSGYITVDEGSGRALFYWLVESASNPSEDPLTLWLNGGPGCSSVAGGMLSEIGPMFPNKLGESLEANAYSWNKASSLIFLESPAGVGFSYSNNTSDYTTGDRETAEDNYKFLLRFFALHPRFLTNEFFIMGESYAGHYIPQLANVILKRAQVEDGLANPINLKGIGIGNPWTDSAIDNYGAAFYWWSHSLVSDSTFYGVVNTCNFTNIGPLLGANGEKCEKYTDMAISEIGPINIYDIYVDTCISPVARAEVRKLAKELSRTESGGVSTKPLLMAQYDPCIKDEVSLYLNRPEVQQALHANVSKLPYRWKSCSDLVMYSREDLLSTMLPVYRDLLSSGLRIMIFSGDVDALVPVTGTRQWIAKLLLSPSRSWRPWLVDYQVGGYVTEYEGLTFATVRHAGHMVGYTQPRRALYLFESFIKHRTL